MNWLLFFGFGVTAYIGISIFAQLTGGQGSTLLQVAINSIKPLSLLVLVVANVLFGMAVFMGFKNTQFAIPATIAIGVITSVCYSVFVLGGQLTMSKVGGIFLVLAGIYLLA